MSFYEYEEMLKKGMEKIPKDILRKERFELPAVIVEAQGNKSSFKNFGDVVSVMRREPSHVAKFISKELATAGSIQENALILQGRISKEVLQRKVEEYTKKFIYCKECGKPDTKLIKEARLMFLKCEACGAKHSVGSL